jgi:hypothetical protein
MDDQKQVHSRVVSLLERQVAALQSMLGQGQGQAVARAERADGSPQLAERAPQQTVSARFARLDPWRTGD